MDDNSTHGERVKASILKAGVTLWQQGQQAVTARAIGQMLGLTHSAVLYHYGNADGLRSAIAAEAVRACDPVVVPMLIAAKHPAVKDMPGADRARYLAGC